MHREMGFFYSSRPIEARFVFNDLTRLRSLRFARPHEQFRNTRLNAAAYATVSLDRGSTLTNSGSNEFVPFS